MVMASDGEAQKAIETLNGTLLLERPLIVSEANTQQPRERRDLDGGSNRGRSSIPWQCLDSAQVPGGSAELCLYNRGGEFSIRVNGCELMNSRVHGSEETLAEFACARIGSRPSPRILIGGLGMGFTTAAALHRLDSESRVVVAELVPSVVEWNREFFGELTGHLFRIPESLFVRPTSP